MVRVRRDQVQLTRTTREVFAAARRQVRPAVDDDERDVVRLVVLPAPLIGPNLRQNSATVERNAGDLLLELVVPVQALLDAVEPTEVEIGV